MTALSPEALDARRREDREAAKLRRWTLYWLIAFWAVVVQLVFPPSPRLVWNASASAPVGLYWVRPGARIAADDMVIARTPLPIRRLAAVRHYIPENVPLVKRVAAVAGDRICAAGTVVTVNGHRAAVRQRRDAKGRAMPWWNGCRTLGADDYFLLMADVPDSFDGRYFGLTGKSDIIGKAHLLWAR